jgi:hypothetical protein
MTLTAIKHGRCLFSNLKISEKKSVKNRKLLKKFDSSLYPTKFRFTWQSGFRGEDFFRNHPIRNKNCLWWPYLLTDRDEMSNHNRGLSIDASYKVLVHLAKRFQCCYQTIKEQCIYNSLSDHEWWPRLPSNMVVATSQTWKLVKKISKK